MDHYTALVLILIFRSPTIQPICINSLAGADLTGETMTVVGWGRTSDGGPRARYLR